MGSESKAQLFEGNLTTRLHRLIANQDAFNEVKTNCEQSIVKDFKKQVNCQENFSIVFENFSRLD